MTTSSDRLVETTQALLWERGYVGMSPRAIQDRAGIGQGSMYHHFKSKAALALAAEERSATELIAELEAFFAQPGDAIDKLMGYLNRERDILKGCRIGQLAADPDIVADDMLRRPLEDTFAWVTRRIGELLAEAQASGRLAPTLDVKMLATTMLAVRQGGYVLARAAQNVQQYDTAVAGLVALLAAHVLPAKTAGKKRKG